MIHVIHNDKYDEYDRLINQLNHEAIVKVISYTEVDNKGEKTENRQQKAQDMCYRERKPSNRKAVSSEFRAKHGELKTEHRNQRIENKKQRRKRCNHAQRFLLRLKLHNICKSTYQQNN